jgi:alpha-beta hydrolase superfamily lysophospholipase
VNWYDPVREMLLSTVITVISRACRLRDLLMKRVRKVDVESIPNVAMMKHWIPNGKNRLDAVLVTPANSPVRATLFVCHGIGETVQNWLPVQQMLASRGVASLVFDYAGYGRSSGLFSSTRAESDAIAAFDWLRQVAPTAPIWLLGFSLGSGIAASVVSGMSVSGLVLCAAFTSLREGAWSCGFPGFLGFLVPPIWRNTQLLHSYRDPVLIVHGEEDELFPVSMAIELKEACAGRATLVVVPGLVHDEPHRSPTLAYWEAIISHVSPR